MVLVSSLLQLLSVQLLYFWDWFFRDRFRTAINVWGDSVGAGIVQKLCKDRLQQLDDVSDGSSCSIEEEKPTGNGLATGAAAGGGCHANGGFVAAENIDLKF